MKIWEKFESCIQVKECGCVGLLLVLICAWSEDENEVEVGKEHVWGCAILRRKVWHRLCLQVLRLLGLGKDSSRYYAYLKAFYSS